MDLFTHAEGNPHRTIMREDGADDRYPIHFVVKATKHVYTVYVRPDSCLAAARDKVAEEHNIPWHCLHNIAGTEKKYQYAF